MLFMLTKTFCTNCSGTVLQAFPCLWPNLEPGAREHASWRLPLPKSSSPDLCDHNELPELTQGPLHVPHLCLPEENQELPEWRRKTKYIRIHHQINPLNQQHSQNIFKYCDA